MSDSMVPWFLASLFLVIGTTSCSVTLVALRRRRRLYREGIRAEGTVIRLEVTYFRSSGTNGRNPLYYPVIAWTTSAGRAMETRGHVARPLHDTPPPDTSVEVVYDPTDPTRWSLPASGTLIYRIFGLIGAFFVVVGAGLLVAALLA